jgi:hypothetical protein
MLEARALSATVFGPSKDARVSHFKAALYTAPDGNIDLVYSYAITGMAGAIQVISRDDPAHPLSLPEDAAAVRVRRATGKVTVGGTGVLLLWKEAGRQWSASFPEGTAENAAISEANGWVTYKPPR